MVYQPRLEEVQKHVDHYWMLNISGLKMLKCNHMYAYPGITPDLIIVLEGYYTITYMDKIFRSDKSLLFSFIHHKVYIDFSALRSCIIVKFKSRGISSIRPFLGVDARTIMKDSVAFACDVFGNGFNTCLERLIGLDPIKQVDVLDEWFVDKYQKAHEGFVVEMAKEVSQNCDIQTIMTATGYSYSTLERYFKKETGLTPKHFQTLKRFKKVLRELYITKNMDWQYYVLKFGYYDQSHFIKEVKRFTGQTPKELLMIPAFIHVRPDYS